MIDRWLVDDTVMKVGNLEVPNVFIYSYTSLRMTRRKISMSPWLDPVKTACQTGVRISKTFRN